MNIELAPCERVRAIRAALGMSPAEFAEAVGVTRSTVYKWEEGVRNPPVTAMRLMERLAEEKKE